MKQGPRRTAESLRTGVSLVCDGPLRRVGAAARRWICKVRNAEMARKVLKMGERPALKAVMINGRQRRTPRSRPIGDSYLLGFRLRVAHS
jgi:hypothetical protein